MAEHEARLDRRVLPAGGGCRREADVGMVPNLAGICAFPTGYTREMAPSTRSVALYLPAQ
jgi:hypothetical protein